MKIVKNINTKAVVVVKDNSTLLNDEDYVVITKKSYRRLCTFAGCPDKISIKNDVIYDNHNVAEEEKEW